MKLDWLFPTGVWSDTAWLRHCVFPSVSDEPRISLSLNIGVEEIT